MSDDSLKPPSKCAATEPRRRERLEPERELDRSDFLRFRHSLEWSQEETAAFLSVSRCTVEAWETPDARRNRRIPSVAFNKLRRRARDAGFDSRGRMKTA